MALLRLTRAVNLTYGTSFTFEQVREIEDYRHDMLIADIQVLHQDKD